MRIFTRRGLLLSSLLCLALAGQARAEDTQIAVAANFTEPAKDIAAAFARKTGHRAVLSFGSSGAFYTQMTHGAPFQLFLSADSDRPKAIEEDGLGVRGTRFTYAVGRLVLYSTRQAMDDGGAVLKRGNFNKIAIADPMAAPYGAAAIETMERLGVYASLSDRIVKGSSIAQAYQFVATGVADIGFVAASQVAGQSGGSRWLVPARLHKPIEQQAILLRTGRNNPAARAFMAFLKGDQAGAIIRRYGYERR